MYEIFLSLALLGQAPNPVFETGVAHAAPVFNRFDKLATLALERKASDVAKQKASLTNQERRSAIDGELRALTTKLGVSAPFLDGESSQISNIVDTAASPYDHNVVVVKATPTPKASGSREVSYQDAIINGRTYKVWGTSKGGQVHFDLSQQSPEVKAAYARPPLRYIPRQPPSLPLFQGSACGPNGCPTR
jgi:hypothetical protein